MMNSSLRKKRAPFGEADVANRKAMGRNDVNKRRVEPPVSKLSKPTPRSASLSRLPAKGGAKNNRARSKSRPRQQLEPPQQLSPQRSTGSDPVDAPVDPNSDATRARVYKAEAYEAKIRIASQEQRIEALQAELDEVRFFQSMENESSSQAKEREKKSKDDAELIEALAQECEAMEKDLKTSQSRIEELEKDLMERSKSENDAITARSTEKVRWETREAELKKQLESQREELKKSKSDTTQGIQLIQQLDSALRAARSERDDAREQIQKKIAVGTELEVLFKSMQNERDEARSELSSSREEVDALKEKCQGLEQLNKELQNVLETVQARSGKNVELMKLELSESQSREHELKGDCKNLEESYQRQAKELEEMGSTIEGMSNEFEAQQEKLLAKASVMEKLEQLHSKKVAELEQQHSGEIQKMQENERIVNTRHVQQLKAKDDLLESRESHWTNISKDTREELIAAQRKYEEFEAVEAKYVSEIEALKDSLQAIEAKYISEILEAPRDGLQSENAKLKAEKDVLLRKLERGLEIHKKTTMELEAKTLELQNLQSLSEAALEDKESTDILKKDYSSAVTLSIERGKKIQMLEKDAETYKSQVAKLVQKIKKMEKKSQASLDIATDVADKRWQAEISSLQEKVRESEEKISALEQGSRTEQLERDLANAQEENDASRLKIVALQEACKDMETALKAVMSRKLSPPSSPSQMGPEEKRRHIEDDALKEYCAHRSQTDK